MGDSIKRELEHTMDANVKPEVVAQFKEVVDNWEHKPDFQARKYVKGDSIELAVFPAGPDKMIWTYVSRGTKGPYPIPKNPATSKVLTFQWGGPGSYVPRTTTAPSWGGPGTVVGGQTVHFRQVMHPGIKARKFEEYIRKVYWPKFVEHIRRAITQGMVKSKGAFRPL